MGKDGVRSSCSLVTSGSHATLRVTELHLLYERLCLTTMRSKIGQVEDGRDIRIGDPRARPFRLSSRIDRQSKIGQVEDGR